MVVCQIRNDFNYEVKFFTEIQNIFFKLLLSKTKPIVLGTIYQPRNQSCVLEIINTIGNK